MNNSLLGLAMAPCICTIGLATLHRSGCEETKLRGHMVGIDIDTVIGLKTAESMIITPVREISGDASVYT